MSFQVEPFAAGDRRQVNTPDGSKGFLRAAVQKAFGRQAAEQRCRHKRENVSIYLPKKEPALWRGRLQRAYERPTYAEHELPRVRQCPH